MASKRMSRTDYLDTLNKFVRTQELLQAQIAYLITDV